jgi:hypothetical protein
MQRESAQTFRTYAQQLQIVSPGIKQSYRRASKSRRSNTAMKFSEMGLPTTTLPSGH